MTPFLGPDFLLETPTARRLFHEVACDLPIIDYHNHLPPSEIAADHHWDNLGELWLAHDHYKWRLMRWAGVDEDLITGPAPFRDRFNAFAAVMPRLIANPVHHWCHLELWRYFGLEGTILSAETADEVWERANACLSQPDFGARGLLHRMKIELVGTTDDPADDLPHHAALAAEPDLGMRVVPSFRPDRAGAIESPDWPDWLARLAQAAGMASIRSFDDLVAALTQRLDTFVALGCVAADHGIDLLEAGSDASPSSLDNMITARLQGEVPTPLQAAALRRALFVEMGRAYHARDLVMQLHIGALRNSRSRLMQRVGRDAGGDSIRDRPIAEPLNILLDLLDRTDQLPRTVLYALDGGKNAVLVTAAGNFQDGSRAGKVQVGTAWWYNDTLNGMEAQVRALADGGLLSGFLGMLTDSRSFLSFPRHEYFRRLLCSMIGNWAERGLIPSDEDMLDALVTDIAYRNARNWFWR